MTHRRLRSPARSSFAIGRQSLRWCVCA